MAYTINQEVFGKVEARAPDIEFQKRALPHAHCIFFLSE